MRINLPSGSWVEVRDNFVPNDAYAVADAPDVVNDDGQVSVKNATGNMWKVFLSRVIVGWSYEGEPLPSQDIKVLEKYPDSEDDFFALREALQDRFDRLANRRRSPNQRTQPSSTNVTSPA
jgi:hypothetical protein